MTKYVKMTVSSNFGNIFSVLAAATLLPFLPMSAAQLLLLNLVYDVTCTVLPWDGVDDELVRAPRRWDEVSVRRFMVAMGPVSSLFDLITFAALFFVVCPGVTGAPWAELDGAGRALFVATFQAGWLVESMWTQTLAVHLVRTQRVPFVESRAATRLTALGAVGVALVTALPFTPLGAALDLAPLPPTYFVLLGVVVALYAAALLSPAGSSSGAVGRSCRCPSYSHRFPSYDGWSRGDHMTVLDTSMPHIPVMMTLGPHEPIADVTLPEGYRFAPWEPRFREPWVRLHVLLGQLPSYEEGVAYFGRTYESDPPPSGAR